MDAPEYHPIVRQIEALGTLATAIDAGNQHVQAGSLLKGCEYALRRISTADDLLPCEKKRLLDHLLDLLRKREQSDEARRIIDLIDDQRRLIAGNPLPVLIY